MIWRFTKDSEEGRGCFGTAVSQDKPLPFKMMKAAAAGSTEGRRRSSAIHTLALALQDFGEHRKGRFSVPKLGLVVTGLAPEGECGGTDRLSPAINL